MEVSPSADNGQTSKNICRAFVQIRKQAGMTQPKFAEDIGIKLSYLKAIEQLRFAPPVSIIAHVAKRYKKSINWMFGLDVKKREVKVKIKPKELIELKRVTKENERLKKALEKKDADCKKAIARERMIVEKVLRMKGLKQMANQS